MIKISYFFAKFHINFKNDSVNLINNLKLFKL